MAEVLPQYKCPVDGCNEVRTFPHLFCEPHWRKVPRHMQKEAKAALIEALTKGTRYQRHQKIARDAIAAVNAKNAA